MRDREAPESNPPLTGMPPGPGPDGKILALERIADSLRTLESYAWMYLVHVGVPAPLPSELKARNRN